MYWGYYDGIVLATRQSPVLSKTSGSSCRKNNSDILPTILVPCQIFLLNNIYGIIYSLEKATNGAQLDEFASPKRKQNKDVWYIVFFSTQNKVNVQTLISFVSLARLDFGEMLGGSRKKFRGGAVVSLLVASIIRLTTLSHGRIQSTNQFISNSKRCECVCI